MRRQNNEHENDEHGINDAPSGLSVTELALLELTNGTVTSQQQADTDSPGTLFITSKSAYLWGAAIALIAENSPQLEETAFATALHGAILDNRADIQDLCANLTVFRPPFD